MSLPVLRPAPPPSQLHSKSFIHPSSHPFLLRPPETTIGINVFTFTFASFWSASCRHYWPGRMNCRWHPLTYLIHLLNGDTYTSLINVSPFAVVLDSCCSFRVSEHSSVPCVIHVCTVSHREITIEPLQKDYPRQRPSPLYDQIPCDGQCFLFVRSPNATNDQAVWIIIPDERLWNECPI